jgi:hypothetical protein
MSSHVIGEGIFGWDRHERISDRYGSVKLFDASETAIDLSQIPEAAGTLWAVVVSGRKSPHIGDIFRGLHQSRVPNDGERWKLGEGMLFWEEDSVGIRPRDGRDDDWLDPTALYLLHHSIVRLEFVADVVTPTDPPTKLDEYLASREADNDRREAFRLGVERGRSEERKAVLAEVRGYVCDPAFWLPLGGIDARVLDRFDAIDSKASS